MTVSIAGLILLGQKKAGPGKNVYSPSPSLYHPLGLAGSVS